MARRSTTRRTRRLLAGTLVLAVALGGPQLPVLAATPGPSEPGDARGGWQPDSERGWLEDLQDWLTGGGTPEPRDLGVQAVPRRDQEPAARRLPPAKRVKELAEARGAHSRTFLLEDGRRQEEVSAGLLNYRDKSGKWQPIVTDLTPTDRSGFAYGNQRNVYRSFFGADPDALLRVELDDVSVTLGANGVKHGKPQVKDNTATYSYDGGGARLAYRVTPEGAKEQIVLDAPPAGPATYAFTLRTDGLRAWQRPDGSIALYRGDFDGKPVMEIPRPYMTDARDDAASPYGKTYSPKVSQAMTWDAAAGLLRITVTADRAWLTDPARRYPVVIDPTIRISPTPSVSQDTMIVSDSPDTNYEGSWRLSTGTSSSGVSRALLKFPLPGVPSGTRIDSAQLQVYYDQDLPTSTGTSNTVTLEAHRATAAWDETTATWNTAKNLTGELGGNTEVVDDGDAGRTAATGAWPVSTSSLAAAAVGGDYLYNKDTVAGDRYTWTPRLTEDGDYRVDVHYVEASDRSTAAPYTVTYNGGSKTYAVSQYASATTNGVWKTLGTHPFVAGTAGKVVLGDGPASASTAVIADAVRLTKDATQVRPAGANGSQWHSFAVRSIVQSWLDGTTQNHGFVLKAADETLNKGGVRYEGSLYSYGGETATYPRLVLTYGRQGVNVDPPATIHASGAELTWPAYRDPSDAAADDLAEYQVHRSVYQTFTPSAATLVAPVPAGTTSFADSTAKPTPADSTDPFGQVYYYMVAVKTKDGQLVPGPTEIAALPKAGRTVKVFQGGTADTTLASGQPDVNQDALAGAPWLSVGNNSGTYGTTRAVLKFPGVSAVPQAARVLDAQLDLWEVTMIGSAAATYELRGLATDFDEKSATWNKATSAKAWTTAGGDYAATVAGSYAGLSNDPYRRSFTATALAQSWVATPSGNHGVMVKLANETTPAERTLFLSDEAAEPQLRPQLRVTYLEKTTDDTYYAPDTALRMAEGGQSATEVTLTNTTAATWKAADYVLSYRWALPDGTDVTTAANQVRTALPKDLAPGASVTVQAQVKAPVTADESNKRTSYLLQSDLYNRTTNAWLSAAEGIPSLTQSVAVDKPTSDQLGLERFYEYAGRDTGAGGVVRNNLYSGNAVWTYNPWLHPSRGDFATLVNLAYNSKDTSNSSMGFGWSLQASMPMRLGSPLDFHPNPNPTTVTMTDGDGTGHTFTWDDEAAEWISPKGVHLYLQRLVSCGPKTEESRAWVMTQPDRTQFYFDCDGYLSATQDRNGMVNTASFTYASRRSNNKPVKFLRYITDPAGRQTLTVEYYQKGENYTWINDQGEEVYWANLVNPNIIDRVKSVTDIEGRKLTFLYTSWGLMAKLIDGDGHDGAKAFRFTYDMTQGTKNAKLVEVTDPRGHGTALAYYYPQAGDDPKFHWSAKTVTDRLGGVTAFGYVDPDGATGATLDTTVTDAENHATAYHLDAFGRPVRITDARSQVTNLGWDADHNVIREEEPNGAVTTSGYDPLTGDRLWVRDAEANRNGTPATTYTYQSGFGGHIADLTAETSPEGRRFTFAYDPWGNLTAVTDPVGNTTDTPGDYTTRYAYDVYGQVTQATDANGNATAFGDYDATGQPQLITDANGDATHLSYDWRGLPLTVTNPLGTASRRSYDLFGRPLTSTVQKDRAAGKNIVTPAPVYDANDNVTKATAPNGAVTTTVYDANDQVTASLEPKDDQSDAPERRTSFTYDKVGNRLTITEPNGNASAAAGDFVTTKTYDEVYRLTAVTDAKGYQSRYLYDTAGNLTWIIDPRKNATPDPLDYTAKFSYDHDHRVTAVTDAGGYTTSAGYDRDGLQTTSTDQNGTVSTTVYDARGKVVETRAPHEVTDGAVKETIHRFTYDQAGNRTRTITPRGVATADDADDFLTEIRYDKLNRAVEQVFPFDEDDDQSGPDYPYRTPQSVQYTYDAASRLTSVALPPPDPAHTPNPDHRGRIVSRTEYYDNGWIKKSVDPFGVAVSYDYNDLGEQTQRTVTAADGTQQRTLEWGYHPDGKLKHHADQGGSSAPPYPQAVSFDYLYDPNGNLKKITDTSQTAAIDQWDLDYTDLNQVEKVTESLDGTVRNTTAYGYNEVGGLIRRAHDKTVADYTYDARDLLATVRNAAGATDPSPRLTQYTYTPRGERKTETKSNGNVAGYEYYLDGLLRHSVEKKPDGAVQAEHTLTYQADLRVSQDHTKVQCVEFRCLFPDVTKNYTYDPRDRVTRIEYLGQARSEEYRYDANNNVVLQNVAGTSTNFQYDWNRLVRGGDLASYSEYSYDPSGRLSQVTAGDDKTVTASYFYNAFDQITRTEQVGVDGVDRATDYSYDPLGRTASTTAHDGKKTTYSYLGMSGEVLDEEVAGAITRSFEYSAWDERLSMAKAGANGGAAERSVYGYDPQGNVEILTTDTGDTRATYGYSLFGSLVPGSVSGVDTPDSADPYKEPYNPYWFGARRYDQLSSSYQMGNRNYLPTSHQYLTPDSRQDAGADLGLNLQPGTSNRYGFAAGLSIANLSYSPPMDWKRELASIGAGLLVGLGVGALAALCPETGGATCGLAVAIAAGAAASAAGYGVSVAMDPGRSFDAGEFALETLTGAAVGAATFGLGRLLGGGSRVIGCTPNSFVPGTKVLLADGSTKDIDKVETGDQVLATDTATGETKAEPVTGLIAGEGDKRLVEITLDTDGRKGDRTGKITATDEHPFWVRDRGAWVNAEDLEPGMWLRTSAGTYVQVKAVKKRTAHRQRVHNLTVAGAHSYYVLAGGVAVLVHNASPKCGITIRTELADNLPAGIKARYAQSVAAVETAANRLAQRPQDILRGFTRDELREYRRLIKANDFANARRFFGSAFHRALHRELNAIDPGRWVYKPSWGVDFYDRRLMNWVEFTTVKDYANHVARTTAGVYSKVPYVLYSVGRLPS
ncbi:DNRLRE domain-containing protein [Actinomadura sp. ATCC 31491]|uniref:DNRLRE domain-containing protein n=1 Tax=Actinomadura luzonensis TaxID=2805427 RepID=A0ABT0FYT2_9ACTN|nr:DNRLRE domain-containing protein [Actinomadura luzonensis]MCK2217509.1 DNRLRE domain-containing protein [Actinomadura luzonensis]